MKKTKKILLSFVLSLSLMFSFSTSALAYNYSYDNIYTVTDWDDFYEQLYLFSTGQLDTITFNVSNIYVSDMLQTNNCIFSTNIGVLSTGLNLEDYNFVYEQMYASYADYYAGKPPMELISIRWDNENSKYYAQEANKKADEIINSIITDNMSEQDKVIAISTWLKNNCTYDYNAYNSSITNAWLLQGTVYETSYTAYGPLCNGTGTCMGYSQAFNLLCRKAGIASIMVTDARNRNHGWNIYVVNNCIYAIDTTNEEIYGGNVNDYGYFDQQDCYPILLSWVMDALN